MLSPCGLNEPAGFNKASKRSKLFCTDMIVLAMDNTSIISRRPDFYAVTTYVN